MRFRFFVFVTLFLTTPLFAQIDPVRVTIARDGYGVPHVFAPTDAEVAYGLAWAHAEDDFKTIQQLVMPAKGLLGREIGKQGAAADYVVQLLRAPELVDSLGAAALSPDFRAVLEGYLQGMNDYARAHPSEVRQKRLFPLKLTDYLRTVVLSLSVISGVDDALQQIYGGRVPMLNFLKATGSNAIAVHRSKTVEDETFLAINSHQPLEGPVAWYEAHLCSDEGWNVLGGLFPGGATVFHGVNEHLGWAHTVNYQDRLDVYQLQTDPARPNQYFFDGNWLFLEEKTVRLRVKGLPVAVRRKAYWSKYGPTVVTKRGTFAIRTGAFMDFRGMEQWYRMNKARSFHEFYDALKPVHLPMFNVVYADRDTIFYVSNGKMPLRERGFNWRGTLPGNTSKTLWTRFHPLSDLPQYVNPKGGYLFNMNHSPFNATAPADNLKPAAFDPAMGYERHNNNRSTRFGELMRGVEKLDYAHFKRLKYDLQLPKKPAYGWADFNPLFTLKPGEAGDVRDLVETLNAWNRQATTDSRGAAVFLRFYKFWESRKPASARMTAVDCLEGLRVVKADFLKHFGKPDPTLGEIQKLVRGDRELPQPGLPDVLSAIYTEPHRGGTWRATQGESYISLVRFPKTGLPVIETVNCYGASNRPASPHFADQMDLFVNQKTKSMTLDKTTVLREAKRVYHPGE